MTAPPTWTAVRLQIRDWERQLAEAGLARDQLALQIDNHPGPPGPELNRLVERFIDRKIETMRLEQNLARVRDQHGSIIG